MPSESTAIQARTVFRQSNEPADTGALWLDTNTSPPTLKQYDTGAAAWVKVGSSRSPIYGDGSDGSVTRSSATTESGYLFTTSYTLEPSTTVTVDSQFVIYSTGTVTIDGTIDAKGAGPAGGAAGSGGNSGGAAEAGAVGDIAPATAGTAGDGGEGVGPGEDGTNGGGGGGGEYSDLGGPGGGSPARNFTAQKVRSLRVPLTNAFSEAAGLSVVGGSGGGAGGRGGKNTTGGAGGDGGGVVVIVAPEITVSGTITAAAGDGGDGADTGFGGGGGGGGGGHGGFIGLITKSLTDNGTLEVSGGVGGLGGSGSTHPGGDGGDGKPGMVVK